MPDILKLEPLPDYGDLITIEEFAANIKSGLFMNQDGTGYFEGFGFTHVEWFNK